MEKIQLIRSRTVVLRRQNVDTDQIIPARFLKTTSKEGLGRALFADWRADPDFPLGRPEAQGAAVLVAGDNFGCGSSREHAPWALLDAGFRAVISTSIADIFRNNALKNGLLPVVVDAATHARLLAAPQEVVIDLGARTLSLADGTRVEFPVDGFARYCLMNGVDELGFLLTQADAITAFEGTREARP
jgi:3-isopropylmalate/(R)-2-methylmalate dehydratase small subunit